MEEKSFQPVPTGKDYAVPSSLARSSPAALLVKVIASTFQGKGYAKTSLFAQRLVPGLSL